MSTHQQHKQEKYPRRDAAGFDVQFGSGAAVLPPGPCAEAYGIAGYQDWFVAATPRA